MVSKVIGRLVGPLLAVAFVACGGDGAGGSGIDVTWTPGRLTATYPQGTSPDSIPIQVRLSSLPSGPVYAGLLDEDRVLAGSEVAVSYAGDNTFESGLTPSCDLPVGRHQGTLKLLLCKDDACSEWYGLSGEDLPYEFTVTEGKVLTISIDGTIQSDLGVPCHRGWFDLDAAGQVVSLQSTVPVQWSRSLATSAGRPVIADEVVTATTWSATVSGVSLAGGGVPPGDMAGMVEIIATPIDDPAQIIRLSFNLWGR